MFLVSAAKWLDMELAKSLVVAILQVWNRNNKGNDTDFAHFSGLTILQ